jgi:predicted dehydrogenase
MHQRLQWGILGSGTIARAFAQGLAGSDAGKLIAIGSRDQARADAFAHEFHASHSYGSYDALLADPEVEAVYIATPHPTHATWAIRCAAAKKHVLVEKPIAMNHAEASAIIAAARANGVFLMEAFMYRCHPQTQKLVELIKDGAIGQVRVIQATFSFHARFDASHRLFNPQLGGGGILDVGGYCASMARLIAGVARGADFAEPLDISASGHLGESGVDEWAIAALRFPGDVLATLSCGVSVAQENFVRVFGSEGHLAVPTPWTPARDGGSSRIVLHPKNAPAQEIVIDSPQQLYSIEADAVAGSLDARQCPAMRWADTLGNMLLLDRWRAAIGLVYEADKQRTA